MNNCASSYNKQINQEPASYKPLVIMGPTGVGKSELALKLAEKLDGEIINADSAQMYTPLTIGTAKPDYKASTVPHHCYDIIDEPIHYSVMQYREQLIKTVKEIQQRKKVPIIVGGSGFYIKSLLYPPMSSLKDGRAQPAQETGRQQAFDMWTTIAGDTLIEKPDLDKATWQDLHAIDPVRAAQIHPNDTYRIKRAMEIWYTHGVKPSEYKPAFAPWADMTMVWLKRDRKELYERINRRVMAMIEAGWIDEVQQLRNTPWESFLRDKKIIGYDLILSYLEEQSPDKNRLIEQIQRKTRNYAKAQAIFWGGFKLQIQESLKNYQGTHRITIIEINLGTATGQVTTLVPTSQETGLTLATHDLYINQLLQIYKNE